MKYKALILCYLVFCLFSCGDDEDTSMVTDCLPSNLSADIIAFYPFNNGSLIDESGNNNNLTSPNTATSSVDRDGNPNCAFLFKNNANTEAFLTSTNTGFLNNLSAFSVSLWYQPMD